MIIPENLMAYVKAEAEKIRYGRVVIELNETANKIDVITETRERFERAPISSREERHG